MELLCICFLKSSNPGCSLHFYSIHPCGDSASQGFFRVNQAWRLWEHAGCLQSPRAREGWERQTRDQAPLPEFGFVQNLRLSPKSRMPAKPVFFPLSSVRSHPQCLEPAAEVSSEVSFIKNLQQKGQKSSHYGEQYAGSLKTENRVPI